MEPNLGEKQEEQQRLEAILKGAFAGPPTPVKEMPTRHERATGGAQRSTATKTAAPAQKPRRLKLKPRLVRLMIGEALALTASYRCDSAVGVIEPKRGTIIVAEIKFRQITVQMLLGTVLIHAAHAAFENREIAFDCIGRHVAARIFLRGVIDGFVRGKLLADRM